MKWVDLSHSLTACMGTYPSDPDISIIRKKEIETDNSLLHIFKMGTHTGTHMDFPAHIIPGGKTGDKFPLTSFTGIALKVDENTWNNLEYVENEIDGIIYDSGWYKCFNDSKVFYGSSRPSIPKKLIERLVRMEIKFFGSDLPSVDASGSKTKPIHHTLLNKDIVIYETLTGLNELPILKPFKFFGFPLPFEKLDGSPVRALAHIE